MNTYSKFCPNVYLAKCEQEHAKGDIINITTRYGKENECIIYNLIYQKDGFYFYSIVRADGYNLQERARRKAERLNSWADSSERKSDEYWEASQEGREFLVLAEPIKVGHHSERRHRALIERNHNRMSKSVEFSKKADQHRQKAEFWEKQKNKINLSMPESIDFYAYELEKAKKYHADMKSGKIERSHSYSLTYAKKNVNQLQKQYDLAVKLWGDI